MKDRSCKVCVQKPTCRILEDAREAIGKRPGGLLFVRGVFGTELSCLIAKHCRLFKIGSELFKTIEPCKGFDWWETNEKRVRFEELKVWDSFRLLIGINYKNLHSKVNPNTKWEKAGDQYGLSAHGMPLSILFNEKVIKL